MKKSILISLALIAVAGTATAVWFFKAPEPPADSGSNTNSVESAVGAPEVQAVSEVSQETAPTGPVTSIQWKEVSHDFGKVKAGEKIEFKYEFTNTGKETLTIYNVKPSCSCTTPDWSKEPVPPGGKGFVTAVIEKPTAGIFKKSISVTANTEPAVTTLNLSGEGMAAE